MVASPASFFSVWEHFFFKIEVTSHQFTTCLIPAPINAIVSMSVSESSTAADGGINIGQVVHKIVILFAMEAEAEPLLSSMHLERVDCIIPFAPCHMFVGKYKDTEIAVVTNGKCERFGVCNVGTVPASMAAMLAIQQFKPDLVINAGTAGGFSRVGGKVGDAYIGTRYCNHDRRIPIPGFSEYGIGSYEAQAYPKLVQELGYKTGTITTANSLDHTEMDDKLMLESFAAVKDMEAAAIAWVADKAHVPLLCLKVITDIVDGPHPTEVEFFQNLAAASQALQVNIPKVIDFVVGKKLSDL